MPRARTTAAAKRAVVPQRALRSRSTRRRLQGPRRLPWRTSAGNGASIAALPSAPRVWTPNTTGSFSCVAASAACKAAFAASTPASSITMSNATVRAAAEAAWPINTACSARQLASKLRPIARSVASSMATSTTSPLHFGVGATMRATSIVALAIRVSRLNTSSKPTEAARKSAKAAAMVAMRARLRRVRSRSRRTRSSSS